MPTQHLHSEAGDRHDRRIPEPAAALRAAGLRVTQPRIEVLNALRAHPHSSAGTVLGLVRQRLNSVSTQAVYDVLHALTEGGLLRMIEPTGSPSRYEIRVGDNHHHVVCRSCGTVADVECVIGARPCLKAPADVGFVIDEAEVVFWGLCSKCQSNPTPATDHH